MMFWSVSGCRRRVGGDDPAAACSAEKRPHRHRDGPNYLFAPSYTSTVTQKSGLN